ncbi:hypothetical protein SDC9_168502 [bioreactor metagenome]|uniref:Uncharacterized protein n=1 Tax=bioreactor metagenome TaxID=1076179 RepID=A0A645GB62_9ZZZZ
MLRRNREFSNLAFVCEKFSRAKRVAVIDVALLIGADVHPDEKELAVFDLRVTVLEVTGALSERLDLRTAQLDSALQNILNKVIVACLPVLRKRLYASCLRHRVRLVPFRRRK